MTDAELLNDAELLAELPDVLAALPVSERGDTLAILREMRRTKLLVKGLAPAIKQLIADATAPLQQRIEQLEKAKAASGRRRTSSRVTPRDDEGGA